MLISNALTVSLSYSSFNKAESLNSSEILLIILSIASEIYSIQIIILITATDEKVALDNFKNEVLLYEPDSWTADMSFCSLISLSLNQYSENRVKVLPKTDLA